MLPNVILNGGIHDERQMWKAKGRNTLANAKFYPENAASAEVRIEKCIIQAISATPLFSISVPRISGI
jgi:hypothetical protein